MGEYEEVSAGILRLVAALENEGNAASQGRQVGSPALCFSCGALAKGSGEVKLLSEEKLKVLLRALLVSHEDEEEILRRMTDPVNVCGGCDKSLDTLVDLNQQLESARLEFCGLRRRVGRQMILGSLGRVQERYGDWLAAVESVEDVFPSKAPKRLKRLKNVRSGTDEVVKVEEEESDFDMIALEVQAEAEDGDERSESLETRDNSGGVTAAGSTRKGSSVKHVRMKTCRVALERMCKEPAKNARPETQRKRRRSTNESETKQPCNVQQRTKRVAGNGERSVDEEESPEQGTPKQAGLGGGSCDLSSAAEKLRRAIAVKKRSSLAGGGSRKRRLTFNRKSSYYPCKFCPKVFLLSLGMRRHCYVSHKTEYVKDLPFVCRVCYHLFPSTNTLDDHKKQQHESLRCPMCQKYFPVQQNLENHMRIHTGEKPYACDVCNQTFSRKDKAKEHMMTHSGVKPFVCSCGRGFIRKQRFNTHKTTTGHL